VSQLLPAAFAAFTKINDLQARPSQKMRGLLDFFEGRAAFSILLKAAMLTH
jgi:hypothetical protein